jgi:CHC2 zinc finger
MNISRGLLPFLRMRDHKLRYSEFRNRIDIDAFEDAIGFIPLYERRGNDTGYCLFPENHKHGDTTGKFAIHREKKVWGCYVCGGGDLVSLVMLVKNMEYDDAITWLFQFASGVETQSDSDFVSYMVGLLDDKEKSKTMLPWFHPRVLERFNDDPGYFIIDRGISPEIVNKFHLRCAVEAVKPAPTKLTRDGQRFKVDDDYTGPAAIWPHFWQDRLVGWQYRWIEWDKAHTKTPKWLGKWSNTTDFPKEETIFNYDGALKAQEAVLCVESVATALFAETYGVPAVAYFGSKPTSIQLRLLRRFQQGLILAPDNDIGKTGEIMTGHLQESIEYLERFIPLYLTERVQLKRAGADLGDYAQTADPESNLLEHLAERTHPVGVTI